MRFVPFVLVLFYFTVGIAWRAWLQWRRHGETGLVLFRDRERWLIDAATASFPIALLVDALFFGQAPLALIALGAALVLASLALMVRAQLALGASWRVGIETDARPGLVTNGAYGWSRNPIFACAFLGLVGFVVMLPNPLTLLLALVVIAGVHRQVLTEERYLEHAYGHAYLTYRASVPRYFAFTRSL
jgi:protein-S-isoprenylcysteine O-methyltransferase Ste14